MDKSGLQQHYNENEMLRAAADKGQISMSYIIKWVALILRKWTHARY